MTLIRGLDLLATFVFALVGARVAADRRMDYGGITLVAIVASTSGGTLRNVFLGEHPIWIHDPWIIVSVIAAVVITLLFRRVTRIGKTLLVMDTFGLAVATISGAQFALQREVPWYSVTLLGVITAVTGGLLRDVLCQVEPVLLHRETIGTSSLIGALAFVALHEMGFDTTIAALVGGAVLIAFRITSIVFDLNLPRFNGGNKSR